MRVIRPEALTFDRRRRPLMLAGAMLGLGFLSLILAVVGTTTPTAAALAAFAAAVGFGIGTAWFIRALRPDHAKRRGEALVALLEGTFGDDYTLIVRPKLAIRDSARLDGILVGPGGVRVLTVREWEGRYRVRARDWEFDAHGRRGWIKCRTNPCVDASALTFGVNRWALMAGLPEMPLRSAIVFPHAHSQVILEEPAEEVVTTDNAPWWANALGRVRRMNAASIARVVEAVLDAAEQGSVVRSSPVPDRGR